MKLRPAAWPVVVLALLAYVPALTAAPGRMPADSKLYLYLDPARFLGDAATTFDPQQYLGWVPHQHVSYLWPAGPWFWLFDTLGVPDWVAHRLWIGTLLLAAGWGVYWCARTLGLGVLAAAVGALAYQLSPYVLPYVSRTSVMLLPWAGLGWIVGLTVRAGRRAEAPTRLARWADPAALALVVVTVGAVNATALAMIVPAPVLWLAHATWLGELAWRRALATAVRCAVLSAAVSVWWVVMLAVQGRAGADVLPYSESLADVSYTATSGEVWRQLGYWLFYVRDQFAPTTSASTRYLVSSPALVVSFAVPLLALLALAFVRWQHRRFAAALVVTGVVLAVGVHPIGDRSPLMRLLTGDADGGLALALRSSTRALPVAGLGIALALAAGVGALGDRPIRRLGRIDAGKLAAAFTALVVVVNLPALWTGAFVDPAIDRDQDPPASWTAAAAALDDSTGRVLQVPGQEFGAFEWGYTVDHPLAGLADAPLATRDLLPLGSPSAMDLLFAFDDRIQDGTLEPDSVAPVAELLGATDVWLSNDAAFDRFDVTAPGVVRGWLDAADGLGAATPYGAPGLVHTDVEMADSRYLAQPAVAEPVPPVAIYPVEGSPGVARAHTGTLVLSGSGDGVVDAAAAGLVPDGTAILYSAASTDPATTLADADGLLVTDSNRARARHWRSSQDTTGFTESAGRDGAADTSLTAEATGDARLPMFADRPGTQTTAEQRGPVVARASSYGQPFALLPEHRPFMAVDGNPATAWTVGEHGDPIGATFDLLLTDPGTPPTALRAVQYAGLPDQRMIDRIRIDALDADGAALGEVASIADLPTESTIDLALPPGTTTIRITIEAVRGGIPSTEGIVAGVGFAELDLGLGPTVEVVRVPTDGTDALPDGIPVTYQFTRLRSDPADRWRDDPEPGLVREFGVPSERSFVSTATVRLDRRSDDDSLARLLGWPVSASTHLLGRPEHAAPAAIDGDPSTSWITGFDAADGATLRIDDVSEPVTELTVRQPVSGFTVVTELTLTGGDGTTRTVPLTPDAAGAARATVDPPLPPGPLSITLSGVEVATTIDRRFGDEFGLPAAITEIELAGLPELPDLTDPHALTGCVDIAAVGDVPLRYVLTTGPAPDGAPRWLGSAGSEPFVTLACDDTWMNRLGLPAGTHLLTDVPTGLPVHLDRIVLAEESFQPFGPGHADPVVTVVEHSRRGRTLDVAGCADGCWLVLGEGYSTYWSGRITEGRPGVQLGEPVLLDGGFTGWWIPPGPDRLTVRAEWTLQRPLNVALAVSAAAVAVAAVVVVLDRRRSTTVHAVAPPPPTLVGDSAPAIGHRAAAITAVLWIAAAGLLCGPWGLLWGALGAAGTLALRTPRVPALVAGASVFVLACGVVLRERRLAPPPDGGWPHVFERFHGLGMFAVAALLVAVLTADDARSLPSAP